MLNEADVVFRNLPGGPEEHLEILITVVGVPSEISTSFFLNAIRKECHLDQLGPSVLIYLIVS
jgi:hypothetical protein